MLENNEDNKLPGNSFYLSDGSILCCQRDDGNSRYPYNIDGMNLWINSNGYIEADEGAIKLFRKVDSMEEATVDFWGGIKIDDENWFPISITGATKLLFEPENINRYTVFSRRCAYYICEAENVVFWLKACVTSKKQISITIGAINKTDQKNSTYLASFMEFMLMDVNYEGVYGRMNKFGKVYDNGSFKIIKNDDMLRFAIVNTLFDCGKDAVVERNVAKSNFLGRTRGSVSNALSLKKAILIRKFIQ